MPYPYERATPEQRKIGSFWFCIHHLFKLEPLTEPIENRVLHIRTKKPEHVQEVWLRAMRPVTEKVPPALVRAYDKWRKANDARQKAADAYHAAYLAHAPEVDALFHKECPDVPWGRDGIVLPELDR